MREANALIIDRLDGENLVFRINFKVVETQFPMYLEELVLGQLAGLDKILYEMGFIAYVISDTGDLIWKPTKKAIDKAKEKGIDYRSDIIES